MVATSTFNALKKFLINIFSPINFLKMTKHHRSKKRIRRKIKQQDKTLTIIDPQTSLYEPTPYKPFWVCWLDELFPGLKGVFKDPLQAENNSTRLPCCSFLPYSLSKKN
jgi:hypothetical protein